MVFDVLDKQEFIYAQEKHKVQRVYLLTELKGEKKVARRGSRAHSPSKKF